MKVARLATNAKDIPFVIKMLGGQNNLARKKRY
jgi:hypothetical protein